MVKYNKLIGNGNKTKKSIKIQGIEFLVKEILDAEEADRYILSSDKKHIITERGSFGMITKGFKRILLEGGRLELIFLPEKNLFRSDFM